MRGADPDEPHRAVSNSYQREIEIEDKSGYGGTTTQTRYVNQRGIYDQARQIEPRLKSLHQRPPPRALSERDGLRQHEEGAAPAGVDVSAAGGVPGRMGEALSRLEVAKSGDHGMERGGGRRRPNRPGESSNAHCSRAGRRRTTCVLTAGEMFDLFDLFDFGRECRTRGTPVCRSHFSYLFYLFYLFYFKRRNKRQKKGAPPSRPPPPRSSAARLGGGNVEHVEQCRTSLILLTFLRSTYQHKAERCRTFGGAIRASAQPQSFIPKELHDQSRQNLQNRPNAGSFHDQTD